MRPIHVVPVAAVESRLLESVRAALAREFATKVSLATDVVDPGFAYHAERQQYHSTELVNELSRRFSDGHVILGVTPVDLYIPILTFVFGEAHLEGHCAVVSYRRLEQEFYGLPPDPLLTDERLMKESIHEVGHTLGLTHCDEYDCVMAASHAVEWLDVKGAEICDECRAKAGLRERWAVAR